MNDDDIDKIAYALVGQILARAPNKQAQSEILSMLMMVSYNHLRNVENDQFVIGWLESALKDVRENPPATGPRSMN